MSKLTLLLVATFVLGTAVNAIAVERKSSVSSVDRGYSNSTIYYPSEDPPYFQQAKGNID